MKPENDIYIVLRETGDPKLEGRWYRFPDPLPWGEAPSGVRFVPTGRYEEREDGQRAEVYIPEYADMPGEEGEDDKEMYFEFLDDLRESGVTNMFGAGEYLEEEFGMSRKEAREILLDWMHTFSERHPHNE